MGCASSKVDVEERVSACKRQKEFAKQARKSRSIFAAAHTEYLNSLGNIGKAFWHFAEVEFREQNGISTALPASSPSPLPSPPSRLFPMQPPSPPDLPPPIRVAAEIPKMVILSPKAQKNTPFPSKKVEIMPPLVVLSQPSSPKKKLEDMANPTTPETLLSDDTPTLGSYEDEYSVPFPAQASSESPVGGVAASFAKELDWFGFFQSTYMPRMHIKEQRSSHQEPTAMELMNDDDVPKEAMRAEPADTEVKQESEKFIAPKSQNTEEKGGGHVREEIEKQVQLQEQKTDDLKKESKEENMEMPAKKVEKKKDAEKEIQNVMVSPGMDPLEVFKQIDGLFSMASDSGKAISRMLEARKDMYSSNFSESRGFSDQSSSKLFSDQSSSKLFHGISWGSESPRTPLSVTGTETSEDSSVGEEGGMLPDHASTLSKLCALEKKLYEQAKALESINLDLQRKRKLLFNLDRKGSDNERTDNTRVAINVLENRMMIANGNLCATSLEIKRITTDEFYPQMLELLNGLIHMWTETAECCEKQRIAVSMIRNAQNTSPEASSSNHKLMAVQLETALMSWRNCFQNQISSQREYIHDVYRWLRVNLLKTESDPKSKALYNLCGEWKSAMDSLSATPVSEAISNFANTVRDIINQQEEELKIHRKCDAIAKELTRKIATVRDLENRMTNQKRKRNDGKAAASGEFSEPLLSEKKKLVETLRETLETEKENFRKAMTETRTVTLQSLKVSLSVLLQALSDFAKVCMDTYQNLHNHVRR